MYKLKYTLILFLFAGALYGQDDTLRVHTVDVGYGDCFIIENSTSESPQNILIDAGTDNKAKKILKYLTKRKLLPIDWVIITHPHDDHYGGLPYLIEKTDIGHIYWNGHDSDEREFQELRRLISARSIPFSILKKGDTLSLGTDRTLHCLHPEKPESNYNDNSLVLLLEFKETSFLFTGDIGAPVQDEIISLNPDIFPALDVLKLPHHGDALSDSFSEAVSRVPFVVLTTGKNKYKLPLIKTLKFFGKKILRTDYCIDIVLESNGAAVKRIPPKRK